MFASLRPFALVLLSTALPAAVCAQGMADTRVETVVEWSLIRALEAGAPVNAIVVLETVADSAVLAARKQQLLDALPAGSFRLGYRYAGLPLLAGAVTTEAVRGFMLSGWVEQVGLDVRIRATLGDSVAIVAAPVVHALGFTGKGATVVVIDTGIDTDHPDLSDNIATGAYHFLDAGKTVGPGAEDDGGHGTEVAGVITSRGTKAPAGVAPDADILAIKVLDSTGSGWTSDQVAAIQHVVANRATWPGLAAVNMSLGTSTVYTKCPCDKADSSVKAMAAAIDQARAVGIPIFVSAGNGAHTNAMPAPGCIANAISVGATYDDAFAAVTWTSCKDTSPARDQLVCITDRRPGCLDIVAPGALLNVPAMGGGVSASIGGTSYASPHAAGVAALLRQGVPCLSVNDLEAVLKATGQPVKDPVLANTTYPRVDAAAALAALPRVEALDVLTNGTRTRYRLKAAAGASQAFVAAPALATRPRILLGGGKCIGLAPDALLLASFQLPTVFVGFQGVLDAAGERIVQLAVPRSKALVGVTLYLGFLTYATAVRQVSWPLRQTIQ